MVPWWKKRRKRSKRRKRKRSKRRKRKRSKRRKRKRSKRRKRKRSKRRKRKRSKRSKRRKRKRKRRRKKRRIGVAVHLNSLQDSMAVVSKQLNELWSVNMIRIFFEPLFSLASSIHPPTSPSLEQHNANKGDCDSTAVSCIAHPLVTLISLWQHSYCAWQCFCCVS